MGLLDENAAPSAFNPQEQQLVFQALAQRLGPQKAAVVLQQLMQHTGLAQAAGPQPAAQAPAAGPPQPQPGPTPDQPGAMPTADPRGPESPVDPAAQAEMQAEMDSDSGAGLPVPGLKPPQPGMGVEGGWPIRSASPRKRAGQIVASESDRLNRAELARLLARRAAQAQGT